MKTVKIIFVALLVLSVTALQAQRIKILEGDLGFLKGQTAVLVEYDYSDMAVGKFDKEADYIAKKTEEYNKKEAGKGDSWSQAWVNDRETRFEPKFEELLNKSVNDKGLTMNKTVTGAKYKMILKTTFTEPGFNVYVTRKNAEINVQAIFINIENGDKVAVIESLNNPGATFGGYDFDTGLRIAEAYAKCGKELGAFIVKKGLK
jgi:hypothetical protein